MAQIFAVPVLIGSLRQNSYSSFVAQALEANSRSNLSWRRVPIADLPLYNQDRDGERAPLSYKSFREAITASDAVLFVTPEYNRSAPAGLKNAIDVGSRPYGAGAMIGKPAAIISQSPGAMGGFRANHAIRQSLVFLNMPTLQQPEAYLGRIADAFDASGSLTSSSLAEFFTNFASAFATHISRSKSQRSS